MVQAAAASYSGGEIEEWLFATKGSTSRLALEPNQTSAALIHAAWKA